MNYCVRAGEQLWAGYQTVNVYFCIDKSEDVIKLSSLNRGELLLLLMVDAMPNGITCISSIAIN